MNNHMFDEPFILFRIAAFPLGLIILIGFIILLIKSIHMDSMSPNPSSTNSFSSKILIKNFYYYLVSFVALMMFIISAVGLVSTITRVALDPGAGKYGFSGPMMPYSAECQPPNTSTSTQARCDRERQELKAEQIKSQRVANYSELASDAALLVLSIPLFLFHIGKARKKDNCAC